MQRVLARCVALPWLGAAYYHAGSRTVGLPQVGEADWDATHIYMGWNAGSGDTFSAGQLRVIAPPGANRVVLPRLPDELMRYLPDDVRSVTLALALIDDAAHDGWHEARQVGYIHPLYEFDDWLFDPAAGDSVRVSLSAAPPLQQLGPMGASAMAIGVAGPGSGGGLAGE